MEDSNGRIDESELIDGLSINYMKYSGLWKIINHYRVYGEKNVTLKIGMFITFIVLCPFITSSLCSFLVISVDLQGATLFILNPLSCFQSVLKAGVFWYGIDAQCRVINILKKDFLKCVPPEKMATAKEIMRKIAVRSNYFCIAGIAANSFCVIIWNFLPVVRSQYFRKELNINLDTMSSKDPNKILGGWYPFNYTITPYYEMVYVYEFIVCAWAGFLISLHECILLQLVMMLRGHIKVISYTLSSLRRSDFFVNQNVSLGKYQQNGVNSTKAVNDRMYEQLLKSLKDHQRTMRIGDEIRVLYNFLITMQLGTGLLIMIISVFHFLYGSKDVLFTFKFIVYLNYIMVENVLYCYSGAFLEAASDEISFAVYSSEWYNSETRFRNTGQMLMVRSLHPVSLIAVQLYPVNLTTLTNLLQLTYSTSALLSRVVE